MKHITLTTLLVSVITFSSAVFADGFVNTPQGNYTGPSNTAAKFMTIKQAKSMSDDTYVTIRGKIVQHIKEDNYLLKDSTDQVIVEIDDDLWQGLTVGPNETVEIIGEVDKDSPWGKVEIEAKHIRKI